MQPNSHVALARYAGLQKVAGPNDPLIARLRAAIAAQDTSAADSADLGFALGKALDSCGAWDGAFAAYAAANRASRQSAAPGTGVYDRRGHERLIDELIATFRPGLPVAARLPQSTRPLFICGMFRSGSTLAEQILAAHSRVAAGGELAFLPSVARAELAPFPATMATLPQARLDALAARYLEMLARLFPRGERVTDKRPDNFLYIGLIKSLFPDAKIVHTVRDPLDNCLSIYFLHLDHGMSYALDLADIAHYYAQYRRLMAHWKTLYGADIFDLDYDALVREPRVGHRATDAVLRSRMGGSVPVVRAGRASGEDRERVAGARAFVSAFLGPLAQLRRADRAAADASPESWNRNRGLEGYHPTGRVRTHCDSTHFSPDVGGVPACTVS